MRSVLALYLAVGLLACAPAAQPTLTLTAAPPTLDGLGRTSYLRVVATEADGTIGTGTIVLQAFVGELDETTIELDAFGTVRTRFTCTSTTTGCTPGAPLDVEARWMKEGQRVAVATRSLRIESPPRVWTRASCPEEAKLIYLFTDTADLYSFYPPTKDLRRIGKLACPAAGGATPNSMAVSQDGSGWVNYGDGSLFRINVRTVNCAATSFVPPAGWTRFGMGFSPDSADSPDETLFIAANGALARVDLGAMRASVVGSFGGAATGTAELTGTPEGKLFGFFPPSTAGGVMSLAEVSKATAVTSGLRVFPSLTLGQAYAYAFSSWGPDFYLYTSSDGAPTTVTQYLTGTDTDSTWLTAAPGVRILGAGASRCGGD
ncbi:MAG: hypothetical protein IT380_13145 [Myxococcales bacterium]|nr:hypothetical protein [Myxococcales bacterium]